MVNAVELYKKYRETFLADRARQEMQVAAFGESVKSLDPKLFEGKVEIPENFTLQALMPELYAEEPDEEVYSKQYEKTTELFNKINEIFDSINQEAEKCYYEYQERISKQQ